MGLLDRVNAALPGRRDETRNAVDNWLTDYLVPSGFGQFLYGGSSYPVGLNTSYGFTRAQEIQRSLPGYYAAVRQCPPAFAAQMVRAQVLSQARFTFRNRLSSGTPRRQFGTRDLGLLERPWTNATTGELITRMEWHAGLAGNAFVTNRTPGRLRIMRPDWTAIVWGSESDPEYYPGLALDSQLLGYAYQQGGIGTSGTAVQFLLPDEVAHWSPMPDPEYAGIGMSWITPALREIQGDVLTAQHKIKFFENGATPNLVVKGLTARDPESFKNLVDMMEDSHAGVGNAYRTLYLTAGADATVVGADLKQIDFKATQGTGETRIAALSRVHPVILALSEGLGGASLNAGNFGMARRIWGDTWIRPTLQDLCGALAPLVNPPPDAELWFDTADMAILREDEKDAAEIAAIESQTIATYVKEGFTPESAIAATKARDVTVLKHTGLVSVQLQPPGLLLPGTPGVNPQPAALPAPVPANGKAK